jgi:hypothetical protein
MCFIWTTCKNPGTAISEHGIASEVPRLTKGYKRIIPMASQTVPKRVELRTQEKKTISGTLLKRRDNSRGGNSTTTKKVFQRWASTTPKKN